MTKYGDVAGSTFRLSICLKRFYSDERRRCYVSVRSGLRVRWLARRLQRLFKISDHFCLLSAGHLLPPDERLALLSPDDVVEVIPKHYRIFEETSDSEDELVFNTSEQNNCFDKKSEQEKNRIQEYKNRIEINKPQTEQTDDPLPSQNVSDIISGDCNFPFTEGQREENGISQDAEHGKSHKEENDELDEVKRNTLQLLDQCDFTRKRKMTQDEEDSGPSQKLEYRKLNVVENEKLDEVKRKALVLLDQCSIPQMQKGIEEVKNKELDNIKTKDSGLFEQFNMPGRRKRKRVRRRKPRARADSEDVVDATEDEALQSRNSDQGDCSDPRLSDNFEKSTLSETPILRNNTEQNRTARLVFSVQ